MSPERAPSPEATDDAPTGFGLKRALVGLLAVAMLPAGGLVIGQTVNNLKEARMLRDEAFLTRLGAIIEEEDELLAKTRGVLDFAVGAAPEARRDPETCQALMDRIWRANARFQAAFLTDAEGYAICASDAAAEPVYMGDAARLTATTPSGALRFDVAFDPLTSRQAVIAVAPVREDGALIGALGVSIDVAHFDRMAKLGDEDVNARIALFDGRGARETAFAEDMGVDAGWLPNPAELAELTRETPAVRALTSRSGVPHVYASADMSADELKAVAGWPVDAVAFDLRSKTALAIALPILTWILALLIAYFAFDRLVLAHMRRLTRLADALRRGDLAARAELPAAAPSEFVELGAQFDSMAERIQEREQRLRRAVEDERMLLREVYHRVKNNLQLIVSLLNMQARQTKSEPELAVIRQTQDRVHSLALVHQNLYQTGQLSEARLDHILEQLVDATRNVRKPEDGAVATTLDLAPVRLDAERATPAALLAAEALINAFKHAYAPGGAGRLKLTLRAVGGNGFDLTVANDMAQSDADTLNGQSGAGLSGGRPGGEGLSSEGLGANLIRGFARQLRAELTKEVTEGWHVLRVVAPDVSAPEPDAARAAQA